MYLVYISTDQGVDQLSLRITTHSHGHKEELSAPYNFTSRWFYFPRSTRVTDAGMGWQKSLEIHARWTPGRSAMPWCNQWERPKNRGELRWRHEMEIFFVLLALCEGNPAVTAGFPSLRPVTRSFDVFYVRLNKKNRANSPDARLTKAYDVTIRRYRNSHARSEDRKVHILRCMGSKFCVKFQRCPLKFHTKLWTHTPQNMHFTRC